MDQNIEQGIDRVNSPLSKLLDLPFLVKYPCQHYVFWYGVALLSQDMKDMNIKSLKWTHMRYLMIWFNGFYKYMLC